MTYNVGYIGNLPMAIEHIIFSNIYKLSFVVLEKGRITDDLITLVELRKIPYYEINEPNDILSIEKIIDIDFFIMCSFGRKITKEIIKKIDVFNIHFGELPNYKGRHPSYHATVANELRQGITIHKINEKIDEGDIISIERVDYYYNENEIDIFKKMQTKIPELLIALSKYLNKDITKIDINNANGNYFPPVLENDKILKIKNSDFSKIFNIIRAQSKYSGAKYISNSGKTLWIKKVRLSLLKNDYFLNEDLVYYGNNILGIVYNERFFIRLLDFSSNE